MTNNSISYKLNILPPPLLKSNVGLLFDLSGVPPEFPPCAIFIPYFSLVIYDCRVVVPGNPLTLSRPQGKDRDRTRNKFTKLREQARESF